MKEYMELCGKLAETTSDKNLPEDATTTSIQAGEVEIHYNDSVNVSAGLVAGVTHRCTYDTATQWRSGVCIVSDVSAPAIFWR